MPEFCAVRCFNCKAFVCQQKKKVKKWKCPICGSKQSVKRMYGVSDRAKDIRHLIVELNKKRFEYDRKEMDAKDKMNQYLQNDNNIHEINQIMENETEQIEQRPIQNKWKEFEQNSCSDDSENEIILPNKKYVLQIPDKYTKNKQNKKNKTKKINQKRSRNEYEEYNKYNNKYETITKKIKTNQSLNINNVKNNKNNKNNDDDNEWNWDVWNNENDSNQSNEINENIIKQSNPLLQTQKKTLTHMQTPNKNLLESESDNEEYANECIQNTDNTNILFDVNSEDNSKKNVDTTLQSQNETNKINVYQNENKGNSAKWSKYL